MFKIGDRVKCITQPSQWQYQLSHKDDCIGKVYVITKITEDCINLKNETGNFTPWNFKKVINENLSEFDWLDQIQFNFKEGV